MQLQVQILPTNDGRGGVLASGSGASPFNLLTEDTDLFLTEDGEELLQEN